MVGRSWNLMTIFFFCLLKETCTITRWRSFFNCLLDFRMLFWGFSTKRKYKVKYSEKTINIWRNLPVDLSFIKVRFMSYWKCWNRRRTWNLCFLLFSAEKSFDQTLHFGTPYLKRDKASKLKKSGLCSFRSDFCSAESLKENKDSKFYDNSTSNDMNQT